MMALGEVLALVACIDMRALMAALHDLKGRMVTRQRRGQMQTGYTGRGAKLQRLDPSEAPEKRQGKPDART